MSAETARAVWITGEVIFTMALIIASIGIVSDIRRHWCQMLDALFVRYEAESTNPTVTAARDAAQERLGVRHG